MNPENSDLEKHENVKEKLNNLIQKKILDQHEKLNEKSNDSPEVKAKPNDISHYQQGENSSEPVIEITENPEELPNTSEDFNQFLLHRILNEKKKALMRNKEVMQFLQNKLKFNQ